MLPSFPKIEALRARTNRRIIENLTAQFSPVMAQIDRHTQFEGRQTTVLRYDETIGRSPLDPVSAEVLVERVPLAEFTEQQLIKKLTRMAEQIAQGVSGMLYAEMERGTTEVGNVVHAQGQPFNEELILKAIEKMEHSFAPDGTWERPMFVVSPDIFNKIVQDTGNRGSGSPAFQRSLKRILQKKRDDFRRREADRILAG
jgi:UTP-glucose-1-phosphate uridylyltransferase